MSALVEVKTSALDGAALDWAVAQANGIELEFSKAAGFWVDPNNPDCQEYSPSHDWSQGGPLIEAAELTVEPSAWDWRGLCVLWRAQEEGEDTYFEHTNLLVAAMRSFTYSKLGGKVSVPQEALS